MSKTAGASAKRTIALTVGFFVAIVLAVLWGGAKPDQQFAETASPPKAIQPPPPTTKQPEAEKAEKSVLPKLGEVQSAVMRVYEGALTVAPNSFLVGDFDGDGSQDLVAVVSPIAGMLPKLNSDLARWKLEDPRKVTFIGLKGLPQNSPPAPVRAEEGEKLLAIIHGSGSDGWRNPEAMNTYLLKNAVGSGIGQQPMKQALISIKGNQGRNKLFSLRGDVIKQALGGEKGFLFWTGADYAWRSLDDKRPIDRRSVSSPHARS